ncbi:MAG: hypothetical protein JW795_17980, partial [Chitinivibrionales bacterium]|nr:hypothetical protein [Chitinivibrionales bacterium]
VDSAAEAPSQMAERSVHFSLSQFDYLLDCAIGMILPRLTEVRPGNYTTLGKGTFLFDLGLLCQFNERWYSRIGVKKSQIRYRASTMVQSVESLVYSHIDGDETLSFITLSIASGRRFPCGAVTPYLFASLEPAYLTAAHQTTITRTFVQFPDSAHMTVQSYQDKNSLPSRHRYTVFAAGGVGCEINYGYGSVFAEASLQMALRTIPIDQKTATSQQLPVTITYRLFTLPLGIGLRFYI